MSLQHSGLGELDGLNTSSTSPVTFNRLPTTADQLSVPSGSRTTPESRGDAFSQGNDDGQAHNIPENGHDVSTVLEEEEPQIQPWMRALLRIHQIAGLELAEWKDNTIAKLTKSNKKALAERLEFAEFLCQNKYFESTLDGIWAEFQKWRSPDPSDRGDDEEKQDPEEQDSPNTVSNVSASELLQQPLQQVTEMPKLVQEQPKEELTVMHKTVEREFGVGTIVFESKSGRVAVIKNIKQLSNYEVQFVDDGSKSWTLGSSLQPMNWKNELPSPPGQGRTKLRMRKAYRAFLHGHPDRWMAYTPEERRLVEEVEDDLNSWHTCLTDTDGTYRGRLPHRGRNL